MASPKTRRVLKDLKIRDENDCSGKHRGLGVHLSFVRSVTMDKWKETELEKMKVGGNRKFKDFLRTQDDYKEGMGIQQKYNTRAAALYRDKIKTEALGERWSIEKSPARNYTPFTTDATLRTSSSSLKTSATYAGSSTSMEDAFGMSRDDISRQKEDFFQRKQNENANRPDDLPPSQGGKYAGFGNTVQKSQSTYGDWSAGGWGGGNTWNSISSGLTSFASGASKLASTAGDKMSKAAAVTAQKTKELGHSVNEKVKDGKIVENIQGNMSAFAGKVKDGSLLNDMSTGVTSLAAKMKGWSMGGAAHQSIPGSDGVPAEHSDLLGGGAQASTGYQGSGGYQSGGYQSEDTAYNRPHQAVRADSSDGWGDWGDTQWGAEPVPEITTDSRDTGAGVDSSRTEKKKHKKHKRTKERPEQVTTGTLVDLGIDTPEEVKVDDSEVWAKDDDDWESLDWGSPVESTKTK